MRRIQFVINLVRLLMNLTALGFGVYITYRFYMDSNDADNYHNTCFASRGDMIPKISYYNAEDDTHVIELVGHVFNTYNQQEYEWFLARYENVNRQNIIGFILYCLVNFIGLLCIFPFFFRSCNGKWAKRFSKVNDFLPLVKLFLFILLCLNRFRFTTKICLCDYRDDFFYFSEDVKHMIIPKE